MSENASIWWCPHCRQEVDPRCVTYREHHESCGHRVVSIEPGERFYTLADLEQARADERGRCIKAALDICPSETDTAQLPEISESGQARSDAMNDIVESIRAFGPIGETHEETERRVRRETVERVRKRVVSQSYLLYDEDGKGYASLTEYDILQFLDAIAEEK